MNTCKPISTPLEQNVKLNNNDDSKEVDGTLYRQLVGSLNYLTTTSEILHIQLTFLANLWLNLMRIIGKLQRESFDI
jgi:hypothetical protein